MHELRIFDASEGQPDARIKERRVDAVGIHVGDACVGIEAALAALFVRHRVVADDAVAGADRAERAKAFAPAKGPTVDAQTLLAILVDKQARRPIAERPINVVFPKIERLEDVAVGIDDIVYATHKSAPFGSMARPRYQTVVWFPGTPCRAGGAALDRPQLCSSLEAFGHRPSAPADRSSTGRYPKPFT